jgi:hypothetical protein
MKPKPMQPKTKRLEGDSVNALTHLIETGQVPAHEAVKMARTYPELRGALGGAKSEPAVKTRTIYVRNDDQTRTGFLTHDQATEYADTLVKPNCMGQRDTDTKRVRVSYRRRTGMYDVVVKLAKEVPIVEERAIGE